MNQVIDDAELKSRHRTMWAWGDYPRLTEDVILTLGPTLVAAAGIGPGQHVLDVAAGSGNASIPAAQTGAEVVASDLTPELLDAGEKRAADLGTEPIDWQVADAENLSALTGAQCTPTPPRQSGRLRSSFPDDAMRLFACVTLPSTDHVSLMA